MSALPPVSSASESAPLPASPRFRGEETTRSRGLLPPPRDRGEGPGKGGRRGPRAIILVFGLALAGSAAAADTHPLRWSRPIVASEGWSRVDLPADVLAACRPGLPDLRVRNAEGVEIPYVLEQSIGGGTRQGWPVRDVESAPGKETTAIVDRGPKPPLAGEATIDLEATEFLKPVVIEASDFPHDWKEIARGSIFGTATGPWGGRMTTLRFAPNDRRFWRLRFDDRNGAPVTPQTVFSDAVLPRAPALQTIALDLKLVVSEGGKTSFEVTLPSENLPLTSIVLAPNDPAFVRSVAVSERVLFRDEIRRRVVGSAVISRGPGGEASLSIPLGELRGPTLEIEIDDGASPPLTVPHATATVAPRSLLFYAAAGALPLSLAYGSPLLGAARYDLAAALAKGRPDPVKSASLGAAVDHGAASPLGAPPHGAPIDEAGWQTKAAIDLPGAGHAGGVAYLPLEGIDASGGLRVVDATLHEVPFLFEQTVHHARESVAPEVTETGARTTLVLSGLAALRELDAIELTASAPDYFTRAVSVVEAVRDARGPIGERTLGSATWERRPGAPATPFSVPITAPTQSSIEVRIENGGNASLHLGPVALERSVRRIDFLYAPGDSLSLLAGNARAGSPSYDLALLGGALLALPAEAAHLEPARDIAPAHAPPAKWFWAVVIVCGLAVAAMLARVLVTPKAAGP
jgi:hypothetical protein